MKTASTILLIAAGAAVLAAVWAPGAWWQWTITAVVLFIAGAGTGGAAAQKRQPYDKGGFLPGPTVITNDSSEPEQIVRHDRPTYGKPREENDR